MFGRAINDVARFYRTGWWHVALVQLAGGALVAVPIAVVAQLAAIVLRVQGASTAPAAELHGFAVALLVVAVLVAAPLTLVGVSATIRIVNDALAGRRRRASAAFAEGFRRVPALLVTVAVALLGTALLVAAAPVVTAVGVVAVLAAAVIALVRRRRPGAVAWWPSWRLLVWVVVPLGLAVRFGAGAALAIPAVVLEGRGARAAFRAGRAAAAPRRLRVTAFLVAGFLVTVALQAGASWLGSTMHTTVGLVVQVLVEVLTIALPLVLLTVVFRLARRSDTGAAPARERPYRTGVLLPTPRRRMIPAVPRIVHRTALVMPIAVVLAAVGFAPTAAQADPALTTITVNTAADTTDSGTLAVQARDCVDGSGTCSLRAALQDAQENAAAHSAVRIAFADSYTIALAAPLGFDTNAANDGPGGAGEGESAPGTGSEGQDAPPTPGQESGGEGTGDEGGPGGVLQIDGSGHRVVLDGQGTTQGMVLRSTAWSFRLQALQFTRMAVTGEDGLGGALSIDTATPSTIDAVTFDHDSATIGGGAVTMVHGPLAITNSTFADNTAGAGPNPLGYPLGGADVFTEYGAQVTIRNSTFAGYGGASLLNWAAAGGSTIDVRNSLFDRGSATGATTCTGSGITGGTNVVSGSDASCPGAVPNPVAAVGDLVVPPQGGPAVLPLVPDTRNAALRAVGNDGTECTTTDQRGRTRPTVGCDAGAVALDPSTSTTLTASSATSSYGAAVTLTATTTTADGGVTVGSGTVSFTVDGRAVGDPVAVSGGTASTSTTTLPAGDHALSATFLPADTRLLAGSTATAVPHTVTASGTLVFLRSSANPALAGSDASLSVSVTSPSSDVVPGGPVTLRDTTAGTPGTVVATAQLSDGSARFTLDGLAPGRHALVAAYGGDGGNEPATSAVLEQVVQTPTVVTARASDTVLDHGQPTTVTATVTGSGSTPPTGTVTVGWVGGSRTVPLSAGTASTVLDTVGSGSITVTYDGDDEHAASTATPIPVTVTPATTTTTLRAEDDRPAYGVPDTLTAVVARTGGTAPGGAVAFSLGGTELAVVQLAPGAQSSSTATWTPTPAQLPVGSASVVATYRPSGGYTASASDALALTVVPARTSVAVTSGTPGAPVGTAVSLTATASALGGSLGTPDGQVVFSVDGSEIGTTTLSAGVATTTYRFASSGSHRVTARYDGSPSFAAAPLAVLTQDTGADDTVTTLTVAPTASSPRGTPLRFAVSVTGVTSGLPAPGHVVVSDGATTIATVTVVDGAAAGTIPAPGSGAHRYRAVFTPSTGDFVGSTSSAVAYTVDAARTTTTLSFSEPSSSHGDPVTLTATVSAADVSPTGTVTFTTGGEELGSTPLVAAQDGTATATRTVALPQSADYPAGLRDVVATYTPSDSADFVGSAATVPYRVARGTVAVHLALDGSVAGRPQQFVATVTTLTGTGHPDGTVHFSGAASGTLDLVDGVAVLTGVHLTPGQHAEYVTYTSVDRDFDLPTPAGADVSVTVTPGTATVDLATDASGQVTYGTTVGFTATVGTLGAAPTGAVDFVATGPAGTVDLGRAALSTTAPYTATLSTGAVPVGAQSVSAHYLGDVDLVDATSGGVPVSVAPATTTVTTTAGPDTVEVGQTVTLDTRVTADTTAVRRGAVQFLVDDTVVGAATVDHDGAASVQWVPTTTGRKTVTTTYTDPEGGFTTSSGTAPLQVDRLSGSLFLHSTQNGVVAGRSIAFDVTLSPAASQHVPAATGPVTISDGVGDSCSATLTADPRNPAQLVGWCDLVLAESGMPTVTATYVGDPLHAPITSNTRSVVVLTSTTSASLTSPGRWIAGSTVQIDWAVDGPTKAGKAVTIRDGSTLVCSSTALSGTCSYTVPSNDPEVTLLLSYAGSTTWSYTTARLDKAVTTCVVYRGVTVQPAGAGTATMTDSPDCGATGYLPGDTLHFRATPADGYTFRHWNSPTDTSLTNGVVLQGSSYQETAYFERSCVQVQFAVVGGGSYAGQEIENRTQPNCPAGWAGADATSQTGTYRVGTAITLKAVPPRASLPQKLYGWSGLGAGADTTAAAQTYVVTTAPHQTVTATFGVSCQHDVRVDQPAGGTIEVDGPNCTDDIGTGYALGSVLGVRTHSTGDGFFTGWSYGSVKPLTSTNTSATGTFTVRQENVPISAQGYGQCVSFSVSAPNVAFIPGDQITLGTAAVTPTGNCPNHGAGWYTRGTQVNITTSGVRGATFEGWKSTLPIAAMATTKSNYLTLQDSGTATASWYSENQCSPYSVAAVPAGYVKAAAVLQNPDQSCPDGQMNSAITFSGQQVTLTATANGGDPLLGWSGTTTRWKDRYNTTTAQVRPTIMNPLTVSMAAGGSFTAWACERVDTTLQLVSPDGTVNSQPLPEQGDWVSAAPAPDCPITDNAYTVGQQVYPQATEDSAGYTFLGWSGAITSKDAYPTQSIPIDGAAKSVALTAKYQVNCFHLTTNTNGTKVLPAPNCPDTDASQSMYIGGTEILLQATGEAGSSGVFREFKGDVDGQSGDTAWLTITADSTATSYYSSRSVSETLSHVASIVGNGVAVAAKKAVGVAAAALTAFVMGDNPVLLAASLVVLLGQGVKGVADLLHLQSDGLIKFNNGIDGLSQMLTFIQAGASCASVWSASSSTSTTADTTLSDQVGSVAQKRYAAYTAKAAAAREEARAAQSAAMTAAYNARLANQLGSTADAGSSATKYLASLADSASAKATAALARAKPAIDAAGKLGDTALIAYAAYEQFSSDSGGWDDSATTAWTTGGDVYMNCLAGSLPTFFGAPKPGSQG